MAEAFAEWGQEARAVDPREAPERKKARLKAVSQARGHDNELVLVVRIELTEEDVGA